MTDGSIDPGLCDKSGACYTSPQTCTGGACNTNYVQKNLQNGACNGACQSCDGAGTCGAADLNTNPGGSCPGGVACRSNLCDGANTGCPLVTSGDPGNLCGSCKACGWDAACSVFLGSDTDCGSPDCSGTHYPSGNTCYRNSNPAANSCFSGRCTACSDMGVYWDNTCNDSCQVLRGCSGNSNGWCDSNTYEGTNGNPGSPCSACQHCSGGSCQGFTGSDSRCNGSCQNQHCTNGSCDLQSNVTCYLDTSCDHTGYTFCGSCPSGYSSSPSNYINITCRHDDDGDGYCVGSSFQVCVDPGTTTCGDLNYSAPGDCGSPDDCVDTDGNIHPGAGPQDHSGAHGWDWNCDGAVTPVPAVADINCAPTGTNTCAWNALGGTHPLTSANCGQSTGGTNPDDCYSDGPNHCNFHLPFQNLPCK